MNHTLRLNWKRCSDGYRLVRFDPSKVDWEKFEHTGDPNQPQLEPEQCQLLGNWGLRLLPFEEADVEEDQYLLAASDRTSISDVLAKDQALFVKFANTCRDLESLLDFTKNHGLPFNDSPCTVSHCVNRARNLMSAITAREKETKRGTLGWVKRAVRLMPKGLEDTNLQFSPEVNAGTLELALHPPDLITALWLQFFFADARDFSVIQCGCCGRYITKGTGIGRSDKHYCSNACRQSAYRKRIAQ